MERYPSYKPTGVKWLGEIPSHWEMLALKHILKLKKDIVGRRSSQYDLLSLTLKGVVKRDMENPEGKFPASFDTYQAVEPNDFIFCNFDNEETPRAVGLSLYKGMITGAYDVLSRKNPKLTDGFLIYYFLYIDDAKRFKPLYKGLRKTVPFDSFMSYKIPVPSLKEQAAIVSYLDTATAKIDAAIAQQQKMIDLLNERKQIIINRAVTKGLNPNAKMKDSGVEWIGDVPEGWEINKFKNLYKTRTGITFTKAQLVEFGEPVISYGQIHSKDNWCASVNPDLIRHIPTMLTEGNQGALAEKGDFLFADTSEDFEGCGNNVYIDTDKPIYAGYHTILAKCNNNQCGAYLAYLFASTKWRGQIRSMVNGVKVYSVTQSIIKNANVILPPFDEQKAIADHIKERVIVIDKAIKGANHQISLLQERKQIIINEVVTGKVKVTN